MDANVCSCFSYLWAAVTPPPFDRIMTTAFFGSAEWSRQYFSKVCESPFPLNVVQKREKPRWPPMPKRDSPPHSCNILRSRKRKFGKCPVVIFPFEKRFRSGWAIVEEFERGKLWHNRAKSFPYFRSKGIVEKGNFEVPIFAMVLWCARFLFESLSSPAG